MLLLPAPKIHTVFGKSLSDPGLTFRNPMTADIQISKIQIDRFLSKMDKNGPIPDQSQPHYQGLDQCWIWKAGKDGKGYGAFKIGKKQYLAHRIAWYLANGPIPESAPCILHKCDNPQCVNPSHLKTGTQKENAGDCANKKRTSQGDKHPFRKNPELCARGERCGAYTMPWTIRKGSLNGRAKLTEAKVIKMREIHRTTKNTYADIGMLFGVAETTTANAIKGKSWKHIL